MLTGPEIIDILANGKYPDHANRQSIRDALAAQVGADKADELLTMPLMLAITRLTVHDWLTFCIVKDERAITGHDPDASPGDGS